MRQKEVRSQSSKHLNEIACEEKDSLFIGYLCQNEVSKVAQRHIVCN